MAREGKILLVMVCITMMPSMAKCQWVVDLGNRGLTETQFAALDVPSNTTSLLLDNNNIKPIPAGLFSGLSTVVTLKLGNNGLTDSSVVRDSFLGVEGIQSVSTRNATETDWFSNLKTIWLSAQAIIYFWCCLVLRNFSIVKWQQKSLCFSFTCTTTSSPWCLTSPDWMNWCICMCSTIKSPNWGPGNFWTIPILCEYSKNCPWQLNQIWFKCFSRVNKCLYSLEANLQQTEHDESFEIKSFKIEQEKSIRCRSQF